MATVDPHYQNPANVLGKFRLIAELGRGGMSEVYLAVIAGPAGFNKLVVIKLIKAELAEDPDFISMFLEEARLSARLNHPNVVQTNEVGEFGGRYYIAMEYLEGQPYSRILHRMGRDRGLPLGMSLRILSDVLQGLQYAHDLADFDGSPLGVVHRDVTPHNVFVTYDGQVKVVDFGIAKAMNSSHETRTGMLKGKVGYMAPEQAKGERVDRRADVFSVGVMLWEAAVGRRMWKGLNEVQILHQLLAGDIPSPRSMRPDISERLEAIIMRSLAPQREHRHESAAELLSDLEELMDGGSDRATLREVGRTVSSAFEDERRKLRTIIEAQLARSAALPTGLYQQVQLPQVEQPPAMTGEVRASFAPPVSYGQGSHGPISQGLPQLGPPMQHTGSNSYSYLSGSGVNPSFAHSQSAPVPSVVGGPVSGSYPGQGSYPGRDHQSQPSHSHGSISHTTGSIARANVAAAGAAPTTDGSKRLTVVALAVAAAAGGLAALLYVTLGRPGQPQAATPSATAVPATPATGAPTAAVALAPSAQPTAEAQKELVVEVTAKPAEATVLLDGEKIGTGTVTHRIPADGKEHELRVEAAGYGTKSRKVGADELSVAWAPELSPAKQAGGGAVAAPPPPPPKGGDTKCSKKGRCISTSYDEGQ